MENTCCILKTSYVDGLLNHLNSKWPSIKLTMEVNEGGSLPFLDIRVTRSAYGKLGITVCHKTTQTQTELPTLRVSPPDVHKERNGKMPLRPYPKHHATRGKPSHEEFNWEWLPSSLVRSAGYTMLVIHSLYMCM